MRKRVIRGHGLSLAGELLRLCRRMRRCAGAQFRCRPPCGRPTASCCASHWHRDDQYRLWTPLSQMSPCWWRRSCLKEDRWFYWHPGVNPWRFVRAAFATYRGADGRAVRPDMQLARMIYRLNTKTASRKAAADRRGAVAGGALLETRIARSLSEPRARSAATSKASAPPAGSTSASRRIA